MAAVAAAIELGNPGFAEGTLEPPTGSTSTSPRRWLGAWASGPGSSTTPSAGCSFRLEAVRRRVGVRDHLPGRARFVDFSVPYYASTQGVLVANDITGPVTLARLRKLQVCAKQVTTGFQYVQDVIRPEGLILEYATAPEALNALFTSICDAFVFDLPVLAAAKEATPNRYGALAGRLGPTERYGVVLPKARSCDPSSARQCWRCSATGRSGRRQRRASGRPSARSRSFASRVTPSLQKARQAPVLQDAPAGLATAAVEDGVFLVVDSRDGRAADVARLAQPAVDAVDLLVAGSVLAQFAAPFQLGVDRVGEPLDLVRLDCVECEWRQLRLVKDLVRPARPIPAIARWSRSGE
jgi:hypothetical protein